MDKFTHCKRIGASLGLGLVGYGLVSVPVQFEVFEPLGFSIALLGLACIAMAFVGTLAFTCVALNTLLNSGAQIIGNVVASRGASLNAKIWHWIRTDEEMRVVLSDLLWSAFVVVAIGALFASIASTSDATHTAIISIGFVPVWLLSAWKMYRSCRKISIAVSAARSAAQEG